MALRLLVETPAPEDQYEYVVEEKNGSQSSTMYIKGPYMQCESVNKNKRIYSEGEMDREVNRYINEMVKTNRAMGELNHPTKAEVDFLIEKERSIAESYSSRFVSYMTYNQSLFPEYTSNSSDDIYPKYNTNIGGWKL